MQNIWINHIYGGIMDLNQIKIDEIQFKALLAAMNEIDWVNMIFQFLLVFVAAISGYFFQKLFAKSAEKESFIKNINKFNEAVLYLSSIIEGISLHLDQLILPAHNSEHQTLAQLNEIAKNPQAPILIKTTNISIRSIEVAKEENFLSKIYNVGKYVNIMQTFYRMQNEMRQFNDICEERNFLIKRAHEKNGEPHTHPTIISRYNEILQRTTSLIVSGEGILDAALFISTATEEISNQIKNELKERRIKGVDIVSLEKNDFHEKLSVKVSI